MKNLMFVAILTFSFSSCKNEAKKTENRTENPVEVVVENPASTLELGCYAYVKNGNETVLNITSLENGVTAKLNYTLEGKDSNTGTFSGNMIDDKLIGTYSFISEGVESKREVAFMFKDNTLTEGYGDLNADGTTFANKSTIKYTSTMPLTKTECKK